MRALDDSWLTYAGFCRRVEPVLDAIYFVSAAVVVEHFFG